jgi:hypothetical protein
MTDRHVGYMVVLEKDTRSDDAEVTLNAIRQIRGVLGVTPVIREGMLQALADRMRMQNEVGSILIDAMERVNHLE